jgi:hypothetical protein
VGAYSYEKDTNKLDYELSRGNPVIIGFDKVPETGIPHWVVATKKVSGKYLIEDPWTLSGEQKSLDDFGGKYDHLIVYEKTSEISIYN